MPDRILQLPTTDAYLSKFSFPASSVEFWIGSAWDRHSPFRGVHSDHPRVGKTIWKIGKRRNDELTKWPRTSHYKVIPSTKLWCQWQNSKTSKHYFCGGKISNNISLINLIIDITLDFSGLLCWPRVLNKDPTIWLDGARVANTCIGPPSYLGNMTTVAQWTNPKNAFASIKN